MTTVKAMQNELLAALPQHEAAMLGLSLKEREFQSGVTLQEAGEAIERVFFPYSGVVSLQVVGKDGSSVETGMTGSDGAIGLQRGLGRRKAFTRAVVHMGGRFAVISGEQFERACSERPALRDMLLRYTERLCLQAQQIAACNASHSTEARLARWLLQCSDRLGNPTIPATQEFLAQIFSVRRTTITLIAHEMQGAGVIRYRRGIIQITDREKLQQAACECYDVMRSKAQGTDVEPEVASASIAAV